MNVLISATNAFTKWLKLDLPHIPSTDGKRIGTQPLVSDEGTLAWQCHVLHAHNRASSGTVIAVEARSRYTILISLDEPPSAAEFEKMLRRRWANEMVHLILSHGLFGDESVPDIFRRFNATPKDYLWFRNTDLSVNGHVSDAEQWVKQAFEQYGISRFDEGEAIGMGMHINQFFKHVKENGRKSEPFFPITRFVDDGLFRFAAGMAQAKFPNTPQGDFPSPYAGQTPRTAPPLVNESGPVPVMDNVVSLADHQRRRK